WPMVRSKKRFRTPASPRNRRVKRSQFISLVRSKTRSNKQKRATDMEVCIAGGIMSARAKLLAFLALSTALLSQQANGQKPELDGEGHPWWQHAVIYEIYPRSFADSNNDGIGDLNGITSKLDYLKNLGVDAIWITPCFPSPQVDFGYDVSDYEAIDPMYGTLKDFDHLVNEGKKRNIRVILDFVVNHTSDQHKWFQDSKSSKIAEHRDWYIWRDAKGSDLPPSNWLSIFGSSAWKFDSKTNQYYYHY